MRKRTSREDEEKRKHFEEITLDYILYKYHISKEELEKLATEFQNKTLRDLQSKEKERSTEKAETPPHITIPISILCTKKLSSLEAIVKYLRENKKLSYSSIAHLLERNPKTLAVTYRQAKIKYSEEFHIRIEDKTLPTTIFSKKLSILESICHHLRTQENSYAEIARMLCKDQRTVWTVCHRAEKKLALSKSAGGDRK